jgi:hypothetical protein
MTGWQTCVKLPLPIALDEELIGVFKWKKRTIITKTMPQYIILKPSFIGGFRERKNGFHWLKSIILGGGLRLL